MGNIFENRKSRQSRKTGSFYQLQRLKEYRGKYRKVWERKNMRCLKYFFKNRGGDAACGSVRSICIIFPSG